jgi:hypothetical protein
MWLWLWLVRRRARVSELPGLVCFVLWLFDLVLATAFVMRRELLLEGGSLGLLGSTFGPY